MFLNKFLDTTAPVDKDIIGDETDRLPAFDDPSLPAFFKENYFGTSSVCDGFLYETEAAYLARLKLLKPEEKKRAPKRDARAD